MGQLKCKMDPREFARLGGKARVASQTPEQRAAVSRLGGLARVKSLSAKVRREISGRGGKTRAKRLTAERRSEISFMGCQAKYPGCKRRQKLVVEDSLLRRVCHLRARGWTHTQIGVELGLPRTRVVWLFKQAFLKGFWEG